MNVNSAVAFAPLIGLVDSVDAVDVAHAQVAECVEYGALGLLSAYCRESPGNTDAWV